MRALAALASATLLAAAGCTDDESTTDASGTFSCMGQIVQTIDECTQAMNTWAQQYTERMNAYNAELEQQGYETGYTTIAELLEQSNATTQTTGKTVAEMIAEAQAGVAQASAMNQVPTMTQSVEGQQALADFYAHVTAINQRQTERIQEEGRRADEAYRQMEARQEEMRVAEIDRLQRQAEQARQDAAYFQDQMAEEARRSAEMAEAIGP